MKQIKLSEKQLEQLRGKINYQLKLRSIPVEVAITQSTNHYGENIVEIESPIFQTVPVIHPNIKIINFGGGKLFKEAGETNEKIYCIFIPVNASYPGNGTGLFDLIAWINTDDKDKISFERI